MKTTLIDNAGVYLDIEYMVDLFNLKDIVGRDAGVYLDSEDMIDLLNLEDVLDRDGDVDFDWDCAIRILIITRTINLLKKQSFILF